MTPVKHIYIVGLILAAAIVGGMFLHAWMGAHDSKLIAEQFHKDMQQQLDAISKTFDQKMADIERDRKEVKTSGQVAQVIPKYQEGVHPILVITPGAQTESAEVLAHIPTVALPDAPSTVKAGSLIIDTADVPSYWKSVTTCAENSAALVKCQSELPLVTQDRDKWKTAANGGSFWTRLRANAKWMAIGAGVGAAAGYAAHH
jgi:hypothetical protein